MALLRVLIRLVGFSVNGDDSVIAMVDNPIHSVGAEIHLVGDNLADRHEVEVRLGVTVGRVILQRHIHHHNAVDFRLEESPSLLRPHARLTEHFLSVPFPIVPLVGTVELITESRVSSVKDFRQLDKDALRQCVGRQRELQQVHRSNELILGQLGLHKRLEFGVREGAGDVKVGVSVELNPILLCLRPLYLGPLARSEEFTFYLFSV